MYKAIILVTVISLTGCTGDDIDTSKVRTNTIKIKVNLLDEVKHKGETVSGLAIWQDDWCVIALPKDEYPGCLEHEARHCLEGNFHEGHKSDEGCY